MAAQRFNFIGVIDSSEGKEWCGFNTAKATSIQEIAFSAIKDALPATPSKRASQVIISKLQQRLPCKTYTTRLIDDHLIKALHHGDTIK